jgi:hypothetical protein
VRIFRIIVRGRFGPLDTAQRAALLAAADEHDMARAGPLFTADGTLSYDRRVDFFSVRAEVRVDEDAPDAAREVAFERALAVATAQLDRRGVPYRDLRPSGTNMADVWR